MRVLNIKYFTVSSRHIALAAALAFFVFALGACQPPAANTNANSNANANTANANNANANSANVNNANSSAPATSGIAAREPDKYRATLVLNVTASGGNNTQTLPPLQMDVARDGANHRYAISSLLGQLIFLDRADKRYLIEPGKNQYAELTPDVTGGVEIPRSMTPGEIVAQLQKLQGFERVGEEQMNGRTVVKYRYAGAANTGTQAGNVSGETFVYVDKDTGLPVRTELFSSSSGDVKGFNSLHVTAEMRDIKTDVDPTLFDVPTNYRKMTPEEVKQQAATVAKVFQFLLGAMTQQSSGGATPTPSASTSPK